MKNKRLLTLGLTFVLLVVVALVVMQKPGERSVGPGEGTPLFAIDSAAVTKVEIISPHHHLVLVKQGVEWYLQEPISYRADQMSVTSMIGQLGSVRSKGVVSSNPDKRGMFQVDSAGTVVTLYSSGEASVPLIVGKMGSSYTETYVRLPASNDVHLVNTPLAFLSSRTVNEWRDKTILKIPREEIRTVHFQYGDTTFSLVFRDSLWSVGGVRADDGTVSGLVSSLSDVQADDFLDTLSSKPPAIKAIITYAEKEIRFYEGRQPDTYRVQASTSSQWFEMKSWRAGQILKRKEELRAKSL